METPAFTPLRTAAGPRRARPAGAPAAARGITLVELLTVLAIVAILVSAAAPSLATLLRSTQLTNATNSFTASLRLARSEAVKRGSRVAVCRSADGATCAPAGGWEQGWIVFHDADGDGRPDPGETVIQRGEPPQGDLLFRGNRLVSSTITYGPHGITRTVGGGMQSGTLTICHRSDQPIAGRQIVISSGGRLRVRTVELPECT